LLGPPLSIFKVVVLGFGLAAWAPSAVVDVPFIVVTDVVVIVVVLVDGT